MNAPDLQPQPQPSRWKFWHHLRFSLASLMLFTLLGTALATTWWRWEPWSLEKSLTVPTRAEILFTPDQKSVLVFPSDYKRDLLIHNIADDSSEHFENFVAHSPDCRWLVQGAFHEDTFLSVLDRRTTLKTEILRPCEVQPECVFSPDSQHLLLVTPDNKIILRHLAEGTNTTLAEASDFRIGQFGFSPQMKWIYAVGMDGGLRIWDAKTTRLVNQRKPSTNFIDFVRFSPDSKLIFVATADRRCSLYELPAFDNHQYVHTVNDSIFEVAFSADSSLLAFSEWSGWIGIHGINAQGHLRNIKSSGVRANTLAFSPDGLQLAAAYADGSIQVFDTTGFPLYQIQGEPPYIGSLSVMKIYDPLNESILAQTRPASESASDPTHPPEPESYSEPKRSALEDTWTNSYSERPAHNDQIWHLDYLGAGDTLLSRGYPQSGFIRGPTAGLWNSRTGRSLFEGTSINAFAVSPDGRRVISRDSESDVIDLWQRRRPHTHYRLQGQPEIALAAALLLTIVVRFYKAWRKPR